MERAEERGRRINRAYLSSRKSVGRCAHQRVITRNDAAHTRIVEPTNKPEGAEQNQQHKDLLPIHAPYCTRIHLNIHHFCNRSVVCTFRTVLIIDIIRAHKKPTSGKYIIGRK